MKAKIIVAGVELEGSPDALPELARELGARGVATQHPHYYSIAPLDDGAERVAGTCWCGAKRDFLTTLPTSEYAARAVGAKATGGKRPKCSTCGRNHLPTKACKDNRPAPRGA